MTPDDCPLCGLLILKDEGVREWAYDLAWHLLQAHGWDLCQCPAGQAEMKQLEQLAEYDAGDMASAWAVHLYALGADVAEHVQFYLLGDRNA